MDNEVGLDNLFQDDGGAYVVDVISIQVNISMAWPIQCHNHQNGITLSTLGLASHSHSSNQCSLASSDQIYIGMFSKINKSFNIRWVCMLWKETLNAQVKRSTFMWWEVKCVKDTYKWQMHAIKAEGLNYFAIRTFNNHNEWSPLWEVQSKHCQVSSKLISNYIKSKYKEIAH